MGWERKGFEALSSAFHNFGPKGLFDTGIAVPDSHSLKQDAGHIPPSRRFFPQKLAFLKLEKKG